MKCTVLAGSQVCPWNSGGRGRTSIRCSPVSSRTRRPPREQAAQARPARSGIRDLAVEAYRRDAELPARLGKDRVAALDHPVAPAVARHRIAEVAAQLLDQGVARARLFQGAVQDLHRPEEAQGVGDLRLHVGVFRKDLALDEDLSAGTAARGRRLQHAQGERPGWRTRPG